MHEPLFESAAQALNFAYNFSEGSLDRPLMSRMADKYKRTGKGLVGTDGAAQAGMILRKLKDVDRLHRAIYMCRFGRREAQCPCCGHPVPADEWQASVREVSDAIQLSGALSGHLIHRVVRDELVARYFGKKVHLQQLAAKASISPNTVTAHNSKIIIALRGARTTKGSNGERGAGVKGLEDRAMEAAEQALIEGGIVGSRDGY